MQVPDASHSLSFPKLKDVHVWVQVDGEPLEVYATDEMRSKSMGYIESVEGQFLELCVSDQRKEQPEDSWIIQMHSEDSDLGTVGQDCSESSLMYSAKPSDQSRFRIIEGEYDAESKSVKRFRFAKLPVSPDAEPHARLASTLGCIEVGYYRTDYTRHALPAFRAIADFPTIREDEVKAGIACVIGLEEPPTPSARACEPVVDGWLRKDLFDNPFTSLKLFYRSKTFLQAAGYIPYDDDDDEDDVVIEPKKSVTPKQPSPSPSPSPKDRSPTPPAADATSTSGEGDVELLQGELRVAKLELAILRAKSKVKNGDGKHGRDELAGEPTGAAKKRK